MLAEILSYWHLVGPMAWPLLATGLVLYGLLITQYLAILSLDEHTLLQEAVAGGEAAVRRILRRKMAVIGSLLVACPMLGLLGTVSGMIETFAAMHGDGARTLSTGIGHALLSTQFALTLTVPALLGQGLLHGLIERCALAAERAGRLGHA